ncbi:molybdopterin-synthase adenylyltransferase MoeB [Cellulomonas soli]|uniref:Adenylyltransferase/sulfurtransferase MoeZ n=1 Tax=Cellulomonas soli TaxID=931535 RepID=A0A512P9Z0_9CELL|nr:molybdopterin-synthase adenylyltransferase MoeB [Cellulomonas soli]NYI60508.1 adenylyltransferase/sulfurtransferase [Cellulomonas soli]GEP68023.1 adenylyltransferase/sulfurtransferase MoeZ [Cellulomonas soli]
MALPPLVEPAPELSAAERTRYSRHLLVPGIGTLGQRRLRNARVLVVGAGGLGSPVLLYLAAAGVGTIGVVDDDDVEVSNLQRQVVHGTADLGRPKVDSAADAVRRADPSVSVVTHHVRIDASNALELLAAYDLVVDGTDTFATRYLVADACALTGIPLVWGSVLRFDGQVSVFWSRPPAGHGYEAVTYRDVFARPPAPGEVPSCAEAGVLGAVCGAVGTAMAVEVVKLLLGIGEPLLGRVATYDALTARWREVPVRPDPHAVAVTGLVDLDASCAVPAASTPGPTADSPGAGGTSVTAIELAALLAARERGEVDLDVVDVREQAEHDLVAVPGARLVPLARVREDDRTGLDPARPLVLLCKSGARSALALRLLHDRGFADVRHLDGGILAWIDQVDPSLPRY